MFRPSRYMPLFPILYLAGFAVMDIAARRYEVIDGDTVRRKGVTYRLAGIDAPEDGQPCFNHRGESYDCGAESKAMLRMLMLSYEGRPDITGYDRYGRAVAWFGNINCVMVEVGQAWAYRRYSNVCVPAEDIARERRIGVFEVNNTPPWEWRK